MPPFGIDRVEPNVPGWVFQFLDPERTQHKRNADLPHHAQPRKAATLRIILPAIAAGALPQEGRRRKQKSPCSVSKLQLHAGYLARTSVLRNMRRAIPVFTRWYAANKKNTVKHWNWAVPETAERPAKWGPEDYAAPLARELAAVAEWRQYFPTARRWRRYCRLVDWLYDPRSRVRPNHRLVMAYLIALGLCRLTEKGRVTPGVISPRLVFVAQAVGLSLGTVRRALKFWQRIGVILVKPQPVQIDAKTKQRRRDPSQIIYLPGKLFTQDEATLEQGRLHILMQSRRATPWDSWIRNIHADVLKEWAGTQRQPKTFYAECWRRMRGAGVPVKAIEGIIPSSEPPP